MGVASWIIENSFALIQTIGIVGSLLFTGWSLKIDANVRQVQNLITITAHHRDIWSEIYKRPELSRIIDPKADLDKTPNLGIRTYFHPIHFSSPCGSLSSWTNRNVFRARKYRKRYQLVYPIADPKCSMAKLEINAGSRFCAIGRECVEIEKGRFQPQTRLSDFSI